MSYNRLRMPWRLRLSVETRRRLTPAVLGSTVVSIAGPCAAHERLDDGALLAAREVIRLEGHNRTDDVVARLVCSGLRRPVSRQDQGRSPRLRSRVLPRLDKAYRHAESLIAVLGKVPVGLETAKAIEQESGTPSQRR